MTLRPWTINLLSIGRHRRENLLSDCSAVINVFFEKTTLNLRPIPIPEYIICICILVNQPAKFSLADTKISGCLIYRECILLPNGNGCIMSYDVIKDINDN